MEDQGETVTDALIEQVLEADSVSTPKEEPKQEAEPLAQPAPAEKPAESTQ